MRLRTVRTLETAPWSYEGWISAKDLLVTLKLLFCAFVAASPHGIWPLAARAAGRFHAAVRPGTTRALAKAGSRLGTDPRSLAVNAAAEDYLEDFEAVREILRGGWNPPLTIFGREALDAALRRGAGAVLWVSQHAHYDLVPKKALSSAGYALNQLSTPSHPFSATRFGGVFLNPVRLRAINRYLDRRVLVVYGRARPAIDALRQILSENGIVLIVAAGTGNRSVEIPFLGGTIDLAVGAPRLAHDSGAALIPVFTLPDGSGGYRIELGSDLNTREERGTEHAVRAMAEHYVRLLEPVVRANPAAWQGWFHPGTWRPQP
jgi:hypothetical protein